MNNKSNGEFLFICLLLAGITLAIYWPARHFMFIYHDDTFFLESPQMAAGFTAVGFDWVIKGVVVANWHPITNFSFLLMHEFFGLNPGAEHLLNILFHAANAVLLFLVFRQLTGATWRSAIVAAIFAWHPLRVESVAWISERKDVLFAFFMLLSLLGYALYAQRLAIKKAETLATPGFLSPRAYYNFSFAFFTMSFLCKATVVTLPFLLLLLDYWPLQRLNRSTLRGLLFEKVPFFAAAAFFCALTFWVHKSSSDIVSMGELGIGDRIENAILSYVNYLGRFFWPLDLAIIYPYPQSFDIMQVSVAALLLLAISAFCILQISRRPWLAMGWFWYLIAMLPVIGLVQIGSQAMADRHTYIALIGPVISLVWLVWEWVQTHSLLKYLAISVTAVVLAVCLVLTGRQLPLWKDSVTLFTHTVAVTPENGRAEFTLALALEHKGLTRQAAVHYRIALVSRQFGDEHFIADFYSGGLMAKMGYYREAEKRFEAGLQTNPNPTDAMTTDTMIDLAWMLATCPDPHARNGPRAVQLAERACQLAHGQNPIIMTTLATAYAEAGRFDDAVATTQKAIALAEKEGMEPLVEGNQEALHTYSAHKTYAQTHPAQPSP